LVLLIALANVVMLLMARNAARQREFSLRQALGAGRGELLRQLLTESLILVTAGGALAWGFALAATRLLGRWAQIESSLAPDRTVLLFTLAVLARCGLLFGLAPLRVALAGKSGTGAQDLGGHFQHKCGQIAHRQIIVVALQMALCVVLLVGAGLLIRTLRNLENTPLGMKVDGLVVFGVKPNIPSIPRAMRLLCEPDGQGCALCPAWSRSPSWRSALGRGGPTTATCASTAAARCGQRRIGTVRSNVVGPTSSTRSACLCLPAATLPTPIPRRRRT
jgi:hypothetical protein